MGATEIACAAIVALYVLVRLRAAGDRSSRARALVRLLLLACAGWVGEDSVIRAYGFYAYAPGWSFFLDRVPLLIVAIWPVVIDSANGLARHLVSRPSAPARIALAGGLIVLADASLIEPIAVHAHLWSWSAANARSVFEVPPIGILGWGYFAAAAIAVLELAEARSASPWAGAAVIALAALATHAALVASWWGALRWIPGEPSGWLLVAVAWCAALPVAAGAWRRRGTVPLGVVLSRAPGAAFFFALLAVTARDRPELVAYALAFAPAYLVLVTARQADAGVGGVRAGARRASS